MTARTVETDVCIAGTGAAGLSAAVTASVAGARVVLLEKSALIGGTTAVSGGLTWVPNNHRMPEVGVVDSREEALEYIAFQSDDRSDPALIERYVDEAPNMLRFFEKHAAIRFSAVPHYPDYHPEFPGGKLGGRPIEGELFDTNTLGPWKDKLRRSPTFGNSPMRIREATEWGVFSDPLGLPYKEIGRRHKAGMVCRGAALIGHLLKACLDRGVEPRLRTRAVELLRDGDRVAGLLAEDDEGTAEIRAARGVVLATGGFEWSTDLVRRFLYGQVTHPNTPPACEGDGLKMAMSVGADLANMAEAWWAPSIVVPDEHYDGAPLHRGEFAMRTLPHSVIVNAAGQRFVNEALNYNDLMRPFFFVDPNTMTRPNLPAWLVVDQQFLDKYFFVTSVPGMDPPTWVARAESLGALAERIGVDAVGLEATVQRFNDFAVAGRDADLARGESAYDRFYGDPKHAPNPSLGPLERPPFYAVQIFPGSLGTKGGPNTDIHGRVLHVSGKPIDGLYAAGNVAAALAGAGYPGPGITIGTALLFGHLAAKHATGLG